MLTTLRLQHAPDAVRQPVAWYLPGAEASAWLDEVAAWPVATESIEFYVCPRGPGEAAPDGALAVPPPGMAAPQGGRALPYGQLAPRVFAPVDAVLWPPLADDELRRLSAYSVLIFHPSAGLIGFEATDCLRAADLLSAPPPGDFNWTGAATGPDQPAKLRAVQLSEVLTLADIFGPESSDIGSEADLALPPLDGESLGGLPGAATRAVSEGLLRAILGLTALVPRSAGASPNWINALENWAGGKLTGVSAELERLRNRELLRLRELLERDPEAGLRHAIPLSALLHRGQARPGARLGDRLPDFSLGRLGGGGAADSWDVPADLRQWFAQNYREQAERELKLGRHRRAAYIFAELLGDMSAAADALKQGRHFHEAAVLYRDRLRNPLAAAACLADAGLIAEALEIYEKHAQWLDAAALHARLGDREAERAAVQRAVEAYLKKGDDVAAARLLDDRLDDPDGALALLARSWPAGRQALAALEERFALLTRRHRGDDLRALVGELGREVTPADRLASLTNLLADLAEKNADQRLSALVADIVRVKAAAALAGRRLAASAEAVVLRAMVRTAPGDRLLARDVQRFREQRASPPPSPAPSRPSNTAVPQLTVHQISEGRLGPGSWARVSGDTGGYHAVGLSEDHHVLYRRANWTGWHHGLVWQDSAPERGPSFFLAPHPTHVVLGRPFAPRLPLQTIPGVDAIGGHPCKVGVPEWLPEDTVQVAVSRFTLWAARVAGEQVVLEAYEHGKRVISSDVTALLRSAGAMGGGTALCLDTQLGRATVALAFGRHLLVKSPGGDRILDLDARIVGIRAAYPSVGAPGWLVTLERGAAFVTLDGSKKFTLDENLVQPSVCRLGDGRVVLIGGKEGLVVRIGVDEATRLAWFAFPETAGIALTATDTPDQFAVFLVSGRIVRWRVPS